MVSKKELKIEYKYIDFIRLIVDSYDYESNVCSATTTKNEKVIFDPFVCCGIIPEDAEDSEDPDLEFFRKIGESIVGHKFVVKPVSLINLPNPYICPYPCEIVATTWPGKISSSPTENCSARETIWRAKAVDIKHGISLSERSQKYKQ